MYYRYHLEITTGFPLATATWASQINYDASPIYSQPIVLSGSTTAHTYVKSSLYMLVVLVVYLRIPTTI